MMSVGSLFPLFMNSVVRRALWATGLLAASWSTAWAGAQIEEPLADSVRSALSAAVGRGEPPKLVFADEAQRQQCARWTQAQEARLRKRKPEELVRHEFLNTVCYEAKRAGLEPSLVLGLIQVESGFRKHAISHAWGARLHADHAVLVAHHRQRRSVHLFHMQTNIRFGCVILRHYLDRERATSSWRWGATTAAAAAPSIRTWSRLLRESGAIQDPRPPRAWPKDRLNVQKISYTALSQAGCPASPAEQGAVSPAAAEGWVKMIRH